MDQPSPSDDAVRETFEFWEHQTRLLGDRNPLQVLTETPSLLGHLTRGLPEATLTSHPIPDKWSIHQIILHLADMEWVFGFRMRTILGDEEPILVPVEQDSWAVRLATPERTTVRCLGAFTNLRELNLGCWRSRTAADLQRGGLHQHTGVRLTLQRVRVIQAGHDLSHLAQIEERLNLLRV